MHNTINIPKGHERVSTVSRLTFSPNSRAGASETNCYSEQQLREGKYQPLSSKVWNSSIASVESLANICIASGPGRGESG